MKFLFDDGALNRSTCAAVGPRVVASARRSVAKPAEEHPEWFGPNALELARIQFGFTVSFFPAISIGLASYLAVLHRRPARPLSAAGDDIDPAIKIGRE